MAFLTPAQFFQNGDIKSPTSALYTGAAGEDASKMASLFSNLVKTSDETANFDKTVGSGVDAGPASATQQLVARTAVKKRESGAEDQQNPRGRMPRIGTSAAFTVPSSRLWHAQVNGQSTQDNSFNMRFHADGGTSGEIDLNDIDNVVGDFIDAFVGLVTDVGDIVKDMVDQFTDSFDDLLGDLFGQ